jgi:hypothetical protein
MKFEEMLTVKIIEIDRQQRLCPSSATGEGERGLRCDALPEHFRNHVEQNISETMLRQHMQRVTELELLFLQNIINMVCTSICYIYRANALEKYNRICFG